MSDEVTEKTISDEIDALSMDAGPDPEVLLSGEQQNNPKMKKCLHNVVREENERFNKYFTV